MATVHLFVDRFFNVYSINRRLEPLLDPAHDRTHNSELAIRYTLSSSDL